MPALALHIASEVDSRAAVSGATKSVFSSQNHATPLYVRSSSCWAHDIDLTCASPWNSYGGAQMAGTLISPRHIMFSTHFPIALGSTVRFAKIDGTVVDRTLTATETAYGDATIGLLDSAVDAGVTFARLLPDSVDSMVVVGTPRLHLDQEEKALIDEIGSTSSWGVNVPSSPARSQFYEDLVAGDSGNPSFVIIHGKAILSGIGGASTLHHHASELNATMTSLGGGYQISVIDLSEFQ